MTVETDAPPTCPTCGAKIVKTHLSLCAYCGSPLALGDRSRPKDRATMRRLAKMRELEGFAEAEAWDPPPPPAVRHARRARSFGAGLALFGLAAGGASAATLGATGPGTWAGLLVLLAGVALFVKNRAAARTTGDDLPLQKRPALVQHRRSETDARRNATVYFFDLVFEDGSEGEFRFPGRGANHDPLVQGNTGLAYTRGGELLAFRILRV